MEEYGGVYMKVCHNCGAEWTEDFKPGFNETCDQCEADLHVCLNCSMYDDTFYNFCREPLAEKVTEISDNNRCPYFDFRNVEAWKKDESMREQSKQDFKNLFGD